MKDIAEGKCEGGRVHSVFNNACNIETANSFITLIMNKRIMAPMSAYVASDRDISFNSLGVKQNMIFELNEKGISCREIGISISLKEALLWSSELDFNIKGAPLPIIERNIKKFEEGLLRFGNLSGIGPAIGALGESIPNLSLISFEISKVDEKLYFIKDRFIEFIKKIIEGKLEGLGEAASGIIGFGPGLTPGMDDFINGLMVTYLYMGNYFRVSIPDIYKFNGEIIRLSASLTTRVSYEMLRNSSEGRANERIRALMECILQSDGTNLLRNLKGVLDYGATSGTDTALGIYVGLKIWTNFDYRRVWLNDFKYGNQKKYLL